MSDSSTHINGVPTVSTFVTVPVAVAELLEMLYPLRSEKFHHMGRDEFFGLLLSFGAMDMAKGAMQHE
jgi:hypothetical protein